MMQQIEVVQDKTTEQGRHLVDRVMELPKSLRAFGRDTAYMGLGVFGKSQDTVERLVERGKEYRAELIERGERVANVNRDRVNEMVEGPQTMVKDTVKRAEDTFDRYSDQVLTRAHLPKAADIEAMSKKVASLDRKLDKVLKETEARAKESI